MTCIIGLSMSTCTDDSNKFVENRIKRKQQYIDGLKKFFEYQPFFDDHNIKVYLTDNTTLNIDQDILDIVPINVILIPSINNNYGCKNKGAGLIEQWIYNSKLISKHEWFIHFEPRQLLIDNCFFQEFIKNPRNLFKYGSEKTDHYNTGLFSIKCTDLIAYCNKYKPEYLVKNNISIEYIMYQEYPNSEKIDKLGLIWHDSYANIDRYY